MALRKDKNGLIEHFEMHGKNLSYNELADLYNYPTGESVRSAYRRWNKKESADEPIDVAALRADPTIDSFKIWQTHDGTERVSIKYKELKEESKHKEYKEEFLKELRGLSFDLPPIQYKKTVDPVASVIGVPDLHFNKLINSTKTGREQWTLDIAEREFLLAIKTLVTRLKGHDIEKFILPLGNDGLNSEGMRRTTTKGTPQLDTAEWQVAFRRYWQMCMKAINYLRQYAPVEVIIVQGNHDYEVMFYLGEVLATVFDPVEGVTVDNSFLPRKYCRYGKNLLMFTHGDKEKMHEMPLIMATERSFDFGRSKNREVLVGHLHKEMVNEYRGIKVRHLPSLVPTDAWHRTMGYHHHRAAQALVYSKTRGFEGLIQYNA